MALVHALTSFDRTNLETCTDGSFADSLDTATVELAVHFDKSTPAVDFPGKAEIFSSGATLASPAWWERALIMMTRYPTMANLWSLRSVEERREGGASASIGIHRSAGLRHGIDVEFRWCLQGCPYR
jgi:hypothetical protein